jgi:hypothetical protein
VVPCGALVVLVACAGDPSDVPVASDAPVVPEAGAAATTGAPGTSPEDAPPTTPEPLATIVGGGLPPDLAVAVEYVPNLALLRRLEVQITNAGPTDVTVDALGYDTPFVDPAPPPDIVPLVGAGLVRDIELPLGAATCPPRDGPSLVTVTVSIDGRPATGSYPIPEPERLQQLNARECGQRAVLERAAIELGDAPTTVGDVLSTTIDVTRLTGTDPITITETGSTLLFQVLPQGPAGELATIGPTGESVALPIEVRATRCDAHVVSQSQLSYRFPVWVQVGGAEPQYVFLEPGPGLRAGLEALVQQCLAREGSGPPGR